MPHSGPRTRCATTSTPPTRSSSSARAARWPPSSPARRSFSSTWTPRRSAATIPWRSVWWATRALTLERLLERLRTDAPPKPSRKREREQLREALTALDTQEPNHSILASLRAGTPEDAIVIAGMTQIGYYSRPFWPVHRPRTYLTSSYSGNLGFEVPTALGAKVARPDRAVVCITGDGGFMYNSQELSTAAREKINAVIVLFNDEAYGNVARDLDESWGGTHGAAVTNPDFMKLADAYGVVGMRATKPTDVGDLVRKAVGMDRPVLIEVRVGRMARPAFFAPMKAPAKYQQR